MRWRSLRFTRLRTTAPPTALLTTKPARAGGALPPDACGSLSPLVRPLRKCTTRSGRPALRPRRTAAAKSSRRLSRCSVGSTSWTLRSGCSGRQAGATLAAAGRENRAAGTGAHTQPEAVGLRAAAVVRLEGALAHSGAPEMNRVVAGDRLAVTVRPREARNTPECTASRSWIMVSAIFAHRRQAAAAIDNSTWLRYARLRHPVKPVDATATLPAPPAPDGGRGTPGDTAWHICTHPVDNDLNRAPRPDYRGRAPIPSRPSREPHIRGTRRRPPPSE